MKDLVTELKAACANAGPNDRVVTIHLFGIRHEARLKGVNLKDLAERAGISHTYGTELRKGVRLADHVIVKA